MRKIQMTPPVIIPPISAGDRAFATDDAVEVCLVVDVDVGAVEVCLVVDVDVGVAVDVALGVE